MSARDSFPSLFQFLSGYFHQDWVDDSDDPDVIVKNFVDDSSRADLSGVRTDLNRILNIERTDAQLRALLAELGCSVEYSAFGKTAREWLSDVRALLTKLADAER